MPQIKHFYNSYQEAIHVAANRDEIGMYDSKKHPFVFYKGYVFDGGRYTYNTIKNNIEHNIDPFSRTDFHKTCIGYFDKKHKKVAVKANHWYTQVIANANPWQTDGNHDNVYELYAIPVEHIFERNNRKILADERAKVLIEAWTHCKYEEYRVLNTRSKICYSYDFCTKRACEIEDKLKNLVREFPKLSIHNSKKIFGKDTLPLELRSGYYYIKIPSIEDILNNTVFTEEEQKHIDMCKFYANYCCNEGFSWEEVKKNWNTSKLDDIKNATIAKRERIKERRIKCLEDTKKNREEAIKKAESKPSLDVWRESSGSTPSIVYDVYSLDKNNFRVAIRRTEYISFTFKNVELKLNQSNEVITSKRAIVRLEDAVRLFNWLYKKCISKDIKFMDFTHDNIKISWYSLRHICYLEKHTDTGEKLGYSDWKIQIGCHAIWMEEVKEFCRYYHLEDKVLFDCKPLNKEK